MCMDYVLTDGALTDGAMSVAYMRIPLMDYLFKYTPFSYNMRNFSKKLDSNRASPFVSFS